MTIYLSIIHFLFIINPFDSDTSCRQSDVANSMDELHRVGTFVHIPEWDDLGSKIRLLVIGHRR